MPTRKVLTVNQVRLSYSFTSLYSRQLTKQVFSILVEFITRNSWSEAFEAVIPQRKYHDGKRKRRKGIDGESASPGMQDEDGDESEDENEGGTEKIQNEDTIAVSRMEEEENHMAEEEQANIRF